MILPKTDAIFFSSSQQLKYSPAFYVREYFSQWSDPVCFTSINYIHVDMFATSGPEFKSINILSLNKEM